MLTVFRTHTQTDARTHKKRLQPQYEKRKNKEGQLRAKSVVRSLCWLDWIVAPISSATDGNVSKDQIRDRHENRKMARVTCVSGKCGRKVKRLLCKLLCREPLASASTPCLENKLCKIIFCQNFVKFPPVVKIFGTKMAKRIHLCKVHSSSTSSTVIHVDALPA